MGSQTVSALVSELQRRLTNLDNTDALAALNRACRWVARQASFEFLTTASTVITVGTPLAATVVNTGTMHLVDGDSAALWVSGDTFAVDGTWAPLLGPFPPAPTGYPQSDIVIDGDTYGVYWVLDGQHMVIAAVWHKATGTYTWTHETATISPAGNGPSDMDPGKAKLVLNSDGSPVQHVPLSEFWASFNYESTVESGAYDTYSIITDNTSNPPSHTFVFFPAPSGSVTLYYHRILQDLTLGGTLTMFPRDFDDLIVDLAEAEERRIYDIGDTWQLLLARAQDQIKVLIDGYRSMTGQPAMVTESAAKIQESTQTGRA